MSPLYTAVIVWVPLESVEVVNEATPAELTFAVPRTVEPSWKVTVPVAPAGTVAVNVTD